jgi:hypothetical protein
MKSPAFFEEIKGATVEQASSDEIILIGKDGSRYQIWAALELTRGESSAITKMQIRKMGAIQ